MSLRKLLMMGALCSLAMLSARPAIAGTFKSLYTFNGTAGSSILPDGAGPASGLIAFQDRIFGTTSSGGYAYDGTVFAFNPKSGTDTLVASFSDFALAAGFAPSAGALVVQGGVAYGALSGGFPLGSIYKVNLANGAVAKLYGFATLADGTEPLGVIYAGGMLYGVCASGGISANGIYNGTVFEVNPVTGHEITLHMFSGGGDGGAPEATLVAANGTLYGTASLGGVANKGVVFSISPVTGAETVLYSFAGGHDGAAPSNLIAANGVLYGTTLAGGAANAGTVFSLDPATGKETQLYAFAGGKDGAAPTAPLLLLGSDLYGTSSAGGTQNDGTLFKIAVSTGKETILHDFAGKKDGADPAGGLLDLGGALYGTTIAGGTSGNGTIFEYTP